MAKAKIEFVCTSCGATHYQWAGQCLECKEWNTLEEVFVAPAKTSQSESLKDLPPSKVQSLNEVKTLESVRLSTGCLLYTSPSPRDQRGSRMPSSA